MTEHIESHSEKDIYNGCIQLLNSLYDKFIDYLEFMDVDWKNGHPEEKPVFSMTNFEIIQTLFLNKTNHSGGTSTRTKITELGINNYDVKFEPEENESYT